MEQTEPELAVNIHQKMSIDNSVGRSGVQENRASLKYVESPTIQMVTGAFPDGRDHWRELKH